MRVPTTARPPPACGRPAPLAATPRPRSTRRALHHTPVAATPADDDDGFPAAFDDEPPVEWLNADALAGRPDPAGKKGAPKKQKKGAVAAALEAAERESEGGGGEAAASATSPTTTKRHKRRSERGGGGEGGGGALTAAVLRALQEAALEEGVEEEVQPDPSSRPGAADALTQADIDAAPDDHRAGFIAIVGRPNAGKSTLMNALLGRKLSIVTPKAQTTRHRVLGIVSGDKYQAALLDTPGLLRDRGNVLDHRMQATIGRAQSDADAVVAVVDAAAPRAAAVAAAVELADRLTRPGAPPAALLLNKIDRLSEPAADDLETAIRAENVDLPILRASALTGAGVRPAADWAASHLPLSPPLYPRHLVADAPERFFIAEIVREKIFLQFRDEVPYATTVAVDDYKERVPPAKDYASVVVYVEREQQKGILVGVGGAALKRLGSAARADIEAFTGRPVFLEISIKVAPKWRSDEKAVRQFGY
jgi:GTPase